MDNIALRMVAFGDGGRLHMICLETDIMVVGESWDSLRQKMKDATLLYFQSFSLEQLRAGAYIRKAPFKYQLEWLFKVTVRRLWHRLTDSTKAVYDPQSSNLRFA